MTLEFSRYDVRQYPTVSVTDGYGAWSGLYEQTVNEEMQSRNAELQQMNNDLINLLSSMNIPIVMLGNDLRVRRFTPQAEKILNLLPSDVGRPIGNIKLPSFYKARIDLSLTRLYPRYYEDLDGVFPGDLALEHLAHVVGADVRRFHAVKVADDLPEPVHIDAHAAMSTKSATDRGDGTIPPPLPACSGWWCGTARSCSA